MPPPTTSSHHLYDRDEFSLFTSLFVSLLPPALRSALVRSAREYSGRLPIRLCRLAVCLEWEKGKFIIIVEVNMQSISSTGSNTISSQCTSWQSWNVALSSITSFSRVAFPALFSPPTLDEFHTGLRRGFRQTCGQRRLFLKQSLFGRKVYRQSLIHWQHCNPISHEEAKTILRC